jgi:hypothetical protein
MDLSRLDPASAGAGRRLRLGGDFRIGRCPGGTGSTDSDAALEQCVWLLRQTSSRRQHALSEYIG